MRTQASTTAPQDGLRLVHAARRAQSPQSPRDPHEHVRQALRSLRAREEAARREARFAYLKRVYD